MRLIVLVAALLVGAIWIEARVLPANRSLTLRLRSSDEIVGVVRDRSRMLGRRLADALRSTEPPAVGAGPTDAKPDAEDLSDLERDRLDRLVDQVTRSR